MARRLLEVCALYAPDHLPMREILTALRAVDQRTRDEDTRTHPPQRASGAIEVLEVLRALRQSGLLAVEDEESVRLHRLTRLIVEDHTRAVTERLGEAVDVLVALFPDTPSEPDTWPICAQLTPHARAVFTHAARHAILSEALATLLTRVGRYLLCTGLSFPDARDLHEDALAMRLRLHEGDHPEVARALVHLAVDLNELGDHQQARDLHEQALAMRRRLHSGDHADLAHSLDNLGNVLHILGEYDQARRHHERALAMRRRVYAGDHPNVAYSLSNLASDLHELGDPERARDLNEQALAMRRRMDPGDHPDVAHSLTSLAADLHILGEYEEAIALEEQALAMRRRLYPGDHPNTVRSLRSLAANHGALQRRDLAEDLGTEARGIEDRLATQWARATA
ncbi:MAG: tetratricopeptide repeat protein [Actinomycetales bacterium]|nr:tetratricopeptide repeat protein [Actinomycetales bacterium]